MKKKTVKTNKKPKRTEQKKVSKEDLIIKKLRLKLSYVKEVNDIMTEFLLHRSIIGGFFRYVKENHPDWSLPKDWENCEDLGGVGHFAMKHVGILSRSAKTLVARYYKECGWRRVHDVNSMLEDFYVWLITVTGMNKG